jgi:starch phosphorylase
VATPALKHEVQRHIQFSLGVDPNKPDRLSCFKGLAYAVRDRLAGRWMRTQQSLKERLSKRVYFLSMEFLPGRFLMNYLTSLQMVDEAHDALEEMGFSLEELEEEEPDAGLGNGGLGRLASCYLDSMACMHLPGYGYGIRYDYGIFHQILEDGYQREQCDNWLQHGDPWEIQRRDRLFPVRFYGRTEAWADTLGRTRYRWIEGDVVLAMACDILIPSYGTDFVTNMRLWAAQSSSDLNLARFSQGDYIGAVQAKVLSESISKVLYPSDEAESGKELRLKQQYFFVAATLQDIIRTYKEQNQTFEHFPDAVAIQLNDTHPSIAIPELMRLLLDVEGLGWDEAWAICQKTFAYTNHTVLPEALETWPVSLIGRLLPRHLEIIYEINWRFLLDLRAMFPGDADLPGRVSLIDEQSVRSVRMAHLAVVGSHAVNGVAELHSRILKADVFADFERVFPGRIRNVTNGITPRRWLHQANPALSTLITSAIGPGWIRDLDQLIELLPFADDAEFRRRWMEVRKENKRRLARYILRKIQLGVDPNTLFDVQIKRMHEYKRQLLNVLHVITLYNRIKENPDAPMVPRTVIFSGKAAPAYHQAKRIIKLITAVADRVNYDADVRGRLRVVFLPNYCVSQAEKAVPAADLSEQISTAGMEASGTGNMKMSLNGALTIGTLDGANIEMMQAVGRENIFIFGLTAERVAELRRHGHNPRRYYETDPELQKALDMVDSDYFFVGAGKVFAPVVQSLRDYGDYFMVLADYRAYVDTQDQVGRLFQKPDEWARRSILNAAHMGRFSSDRAVGEYARRIWAVEPLTVEAQITDND